MNKQNWVRNEILTTKHDSIKDYSMQMMECHLHVSLILSLTHSTSTLLQHETPFNLFIRQTTCNMHQFSASFTSALAVAWTQHTHMTYHSLCSLAIGLSWISFQLMPKSVILLHLPLNNWMWILKNSFLTVN